MNILESIGNTPLLELPKLSKEVGATILGKAEFFNPLGSVKDRIGRAMIEAGEKLGKLKAGMEIIEPTSGNTGIALAFIAAAKGYPLTLVMPETMSLERRTLLLLLGAKVVLTPAAPGIRGSIAKALELVEKNKNAFMPSQFENPANPAIHAATTAEEIWKATGGDFDAFVAGVGTGGTISGCGKVFKSRKAGIKVIAVEPTESAVLSGGKPGPHKIQGIGTGFVPKNLDRSVVDSVITVSSDEALSMAKRIIALEGIPAGISTGAALTAVAKLVQQDASLKGKKIVVILPSYTERYLSTLLAEEARTKAQGLVAEPVNEAYLAKVPFGPEAI